MAFSDYTTPDSVRSLLGASAKEAKDSVITDNVYLIEILERLDEIDPTLRSTYFAARDAESPTEDQARFVLLVQTFCGHIVALKMVPAMPMLAPRRITDGKSEVERIDNPFAAAAPGIQANLDFLRQRMKAVFAKLTGGAAPSTATRTRIAGVALGTDPILG